MVDPSEADPAQPESSPQRKQPNIPQWCRLWCERMLAHPHAPHWTIAFFTFLLVIFAYRAWDESKLGTKALQAQIIESRRQANAAEDAEKRSLRAYVLIDAAAVVLIDHTLRAAVDVKNFGQTPAYDCGVNIKMQTDAAMPKQWLLEPIETDLAIIGPRSVVNTQSELIVPPTNTAAIPAFQRGDATIYLFGQIRYRDVFDRVWLLDFRLRSKTFEADKGRWLMEPTPDGNRETQVQ